MYFTASANLHGGHPIKPMTQDVVMKYLAMIAIAW
jgi:hypothetical protein